MSTRETENERDVSLTAGPPRRGAIRLNYWCSMRAVEHKSGQLGSDHPRSQTSNT